MVSWRKSPKKEGAYPKREIHTDRLQMNTDRLQRATTVKRLQKLDIDFKILLIPLLTKVVVFTF